MAGFASGKISVDNVDLTSSQTVSNKTLDASNDYSGDIIDPSRSDVKQGTQAELEAYAVGASNGQMCFATDTKQMYQVLDGALAAVGGGSGGLDTFFTDTFEVAGVSDYISGNDVIFDNGGVLAGVLADETVNNISGDQSLKYTQAAGSLNDFIKSPLIPIDKKQQGNTVGLELFYTYSGNSDDLKIVGYDDTGTEVMTLSSNLIKASSKAQRLSVQFPVPSGSANLAWGIQVVVENDGAELIIDDVELTTNPFVSKDLLTQQSVLANGGSTASAGIVSNYTIQESYGSNLLVNSSGTWTCQQDNVTVTATMWGQILAADSRTIVEFTINGTSYEAGSDSFDSASGYRSSSSASQVLNKGDTLIFKTGGAGNINLITTTFTATAATNHIVAYNSRNAVSSMIRLNTGNGHGSTNTKIRRFSNTVDNLGSAITYTDSATDGSTLTIKEKGVYFITYTDTANVGTRRSGISLNSTQLTTDIHLITQDDRLSMSTNSDGGGTFGITSSWSGILNVDDVIRPHTDGTADSTTLATFTITKIGLEDLLGVPVPRTAYIKDVKSSGTEGGTFTQDIWQARTINTLSGDTEFISLGTGTTGTDGTATRFTLEPGKYEIQSDSSCYRVGRVSYKLYDITNSIDAILGLNSLANTAEGTTTSKLMGVINITASTTFEIQHRCQTTGNNTGLGVANSFGDEIFTQVKITKVS